MVVAPAAPAALAGAVRRLQALTAEERGALGSQGRRFVAENYNRRRLAERYLEILRDVKAGAVQSR